jgi:DNA-binding CsgD family transcriptional regulator/tetratricopeptide (TPR) repeat protein
MDLPEREESLAVLESCLAEARFGVGRIALVTGEAGIGKTSLARAFCGRHSDDAQVWWGSCDALSTPRPLSPLYDIARAAGGELAAVMASDASAYERFSGFLDALTSALRPVVAVIEDVHWADDATRDLLVFVARRVAGTRAVVIVTYRDDEVGLLHPLRPVLGQLATLGSVQRVELARLSEAAVVKLAGTAADGHRVYEVTSGNPFFVAELIAAGGEDVPRTVGDAVLARAARLSASARSVLDAASIVPDEAEIDLVLAVSGGRIAAVDDCEQAGLLRGGVRSVRFRHELARLAVEQAVPVMRRTLLHARALAHLERQSGADLARLAYHAEQAYDRRAVLAHAPAAAVQATRLSAHRQAAAHYASALRHADALPASERAELLERYAYECALLGRDDDELEAEERALELWRTVGDVERTGRLLARYSESLWSVGRPDEAYDAAREAIDMLEARPEGPALAAAYAQLAALNMLGRRVQEAVEIGSSAVRLAERLGDSAVLARALNVVGSASWFIDPEQAEGPLLRSLEIARRTGDDSRAAVAMTNLGSGAGEVRRYETADRWLREGQQWASQHDLDASRDYATSWLSRTHFEQGRWSEAGAAAGSIPASAGHISRMVALTVLGRLRVRRGDPDQVGPLEEAWELALQTGDLQRLWPAAAGRAEAAWLHGHGERIPDLVGETYELAVRLEQQWPIGELGFWLWRAGALGAAPDGAAAPYRLQINGNWRVAMSLWERIGCPYEAALALADSDDPGDLQGALRRFARLGARPMAERVAAMLREQGVRNLPRLPTRETVGNPGGLTNRELEVLALIAKRYTNAEIAGALHISPKTAGHHVAAILGKLGVHNRRDAVRAAERLGAVGPTAGVEPPRV